LELPTPLLLVLAVLEELQLQKVELAVIRYFPQLLLLVEAVAVAAQEVAQITTETMAGLVAVARRLAG
jgi:hypothetical protein